jgi:SAM-dependent methyltransferase
VTTTSEFDQLLAEGNAEPTQGWDFSWFNGRATEERPSWKYFQALGGRMSEANAAFDVQTGGGERLAEILSHIDPRPDLVAASESWSPNVAIARHNLEPFGVVVAEITDQSDFPFPDERFDLVSSRHPTVTLWAEIARVLRTGGTYFSQQVGAGTNSELTDFMMGPQPISQSRSTRHAVDTASSVGLEVIELKEESLPIVFFDVGAVVYFLRKVVWTVPDFTVEKYRDRLLDMHNRIRTDGGFQSHSQRFLIEAKKLGSH